MSEANKHKTPAFLDGGGEMGERIRGLDWSKHPLGGPETWPQALRTSLRLLLNTGHPMYIFWGPNGFCFYNDAYRQSIGPERHPASLGEPARQVWDEIWDIIGPQIEQVMAGGAATWFENALVPITRNGKREEVYWTYSYGPIDDDSAAGGVGGVLVVCTETTEQVTARRRTSEAQERQRRLFEQAPGFIIIMKGPEHVVEFINDKHRGIFNSNDWIGKPIRLAFPSIAGQGFFEILDKVYQTGETAKFDAQPVIYQRSPDSAAETRYFTFIYAPIYEDAQIIGGVFCEGIDVTETHAAETHVRALAELGDRIREIDDADELAFHAAKLLGETLGVSRAGYGTINVADETIAIQRDWNMAGVQSLAGVLQFRDYGSYIDDLKAGRTVVVADAETDLRTAAGAAALKAISAQSFVNMPVTEQGGFVALLYLNHADARAWEPSELVLIREVAERTRTAVERRRAEESLRALNADLERQVAERTLARGRTWQLTPDLMGVLNAQGRFEATNPAWAAMLGWSEAEMAKLVWRDLVHPDDIESSEVAWADAVERGLPVLQFENRLRTKTREWRWLQWVAVPEAGKVYFTTRDVTEAKRQADALAERTAERDRLWRDSQDLLLIARFDTMIASVNPAWTRVLGWSEHELIGKPFMDFVHPDDLAATTREASGLAEEGRSTMKFENRYRAKDGSWVWLSWAVSSSDGLFHAVARDVTAEKARQAELEHAQEALRQAQKMEAVGQLTGGIAHDFNNLLGAIGGSLSLIDRRLSDGRPGVERYISAGQDAVRRAASLTQRLLAFSRRQTLDPTPTDVNKLISGMEELIRGSVGPNVEVEVVGAVGLWPTRLDKPQLESALLNLCINARDAMAPAGGRLTIETANKWIDERNARERDLKPGQYVSLCVTDTGSGMDAETIERAFDPFFTTKPIGQGTGLGLSMVYGFVRQSGGQVRVYSELGKGTTMCLYLPRFAGSIGKDEAEAETRQIPASTGETVLVIDDEPTLRMLMTDVLEEAGYRVLQAPAGPEGLAILQSDERIDLLVTDVGLPGGMNGRQVADAARVARADLKVLFITGYAENAAVGNGHLDPGMAIVTKPFVITEFAAKVREMIDI